MKIKAIATYIVTTLLLSAASGWCGDGTGQPDKISRELTESASDGPMRVIVMLEVPKGGISYQAEHIKNAARAVSSRMPGIAQAVRTYDHFPFVTMEIAGKDALDALGQMPEVRTVLPDRLRRLQRTEKAGLKTESPLIYAQNIDKVGAKQAWNAGYTGAGWYIAMLDSGILTTHELFTGKKIIEACFSSNKDCPNGQTTMYGPGAAKPFDKKYDGYEHGTHVAGIAAGNSGKLFGIAKDASLIAIQVYSRFTSSADCTPSPAPCLESYDSDLLAALDYIHSLGQAYPIASANMSIGGDTFSSQGLCDTSESDPLYKTAIDALRSTGIATVISAGNDGSCGSIETPACVSSAISVGAVDDSDNEADFNDWHYTMLKFLAPGVNIYSAIPDTPTSYAYLSGTSMATPYVAGAWAILKQQNPQASVDGILSALMDTGVPIQTSCTNINDSKPRIQVNASLSPSLIPLPSEQSNFSYPPTASPVLNFSQAMPVGVGPVSGKGGLLNLQVGFPQFAGPVDIYFAVRAQPVDPATLYLFVPGNSLQPIAMGMIPWQKDTVGPISESLFGELPVSMLPQGNYTLYLAVTPAGRLDSYYLWATDFTI